MENRSVSWSVGRAAGWEAGHPGRLRNTVVGSWTLNKDMHWMVFAIGLLIWGSNINPKGSNGSKRSRAQVVGVGRGSGWQSVEGWLVGWLVGL